MLTFYIVLNCSFIMFLHSEDDIQKTKMELITYQLTSKLKFSIFSHAYIFFHIAILYTKN